MASPRSKKERRRSGFRGGSPTPVGSLIGELIEPYLERARAQVEREIARADPDLDPESVNNATQNLTLLAMGAINLAQFPEADANRLAKKLIRGLPRRSRAVATETLKEMTIRARAILSGS